MEGKLKFDNKYWDNISNEAIDLIKKMLEIDPEKRYKAEDCLRHEWITKNNNHIDVEPKKIENCLSNLKNFRVNKIL